MCQIPPEYGKLQHQFMNVLMHRRVVLYEDTFGVFYCIYPSGIGKTLTLFVWIVCRAIKVFNFSPENVINVLIGDP
jgi:hypothetical protein